jgi:hypothetical protein
MSPRDIGTNNHSRFHPTSELLRQLHFEYSQVPISKTDSIWLPLSQTRFASHFLLCLVYVRFNMSYNSPKSKDLSTNFLQNAISNGGCCFFLGNYALITNVSYIWSTVFSERTSPVNKSVVPTNVFGSGCVSAWKFMTK